jgi:hypothetical protein
MGGHTSSIRYCQHSSRYNLTTQAPPLRQSSDTFGGGGRYAFFWDVKQRRLVVTCRCFGKTCRYHLQGSRSQGRNLDGLTFQQGSDRLPRNVNKYQSTLHNIPEERTSHLHGSEGLKSRNSDGVRHFTSFYRTDWRTKLWI